MLRNTQRKRAYENRHPGSGFRNSIRNFIRKTKGRAAYKGPGIPVRIILAGIILPRAKTGQASADSAGETDPEEKENRKGKHGSSAGEEAIQKNSLLKTGTPCSLPPYRRRNITQGNAADE